MQYAENIEVIGNCTPELYRYIHKVAKFLGISTLPGHVELEIVEDLGRFAGLVDGDEDQVDISIAETFNGERIDDTQIKINIAHEMIHAVQILTGRLIHSGLSLEGGIMSYKWIFDGEEYQNLIYSDQPWENEAYEYEKEVYEAIQSGRKVCGAIQSRLYPRWQKEGSQEEGLSRRSVVPKEWFLTTWQTPTYEL